MRQAGVLIMRRQRVPRIERIDNTVCCEVLGCLCLYPDNSYGLYSYGLVACACTRTILYYYIGCLCLYPDNSPIIKLRFRVPRRITLFPWTDRKKPHRCPVKKCLTRPSGLEPDNRVWRPLLFRQRLGWHLRTVDVGSIEEGVRLVGYCRM